jgi:tRNA pseudouridine55 synthase
MKSSPAPSRRLNGVLLLNKPVGISSHHAVFKAKRIFAAQKAGHTGTLDPMASGLLPVCFGEATKFSHWLIDADKQYLATIKLGVTTSTGDMEGEIRKTSPVRVRSADVIAVLNDWVGEKVQIPPMYSALKYAGKPLYRYAREGIEIERAPRPIHIKKIDLIDFAGDALTISLQCSKGTYVRVLAEDIGRVLGCGGSLAALERTAVGEFRLDSAMTLDELSLLPEGRRESVLKRVDALVATLPRVDLDAMQAGKIRTGLALPDVAAASEGLVRVYGPEESYLGLAEMRSDGALVPRRLMS